MAGGGLEVEEGAVGDHQLVAARAADGEAAPGIVGEAVGEGITRIRVRGGEYPDGESIGGILVHGGIAQGDVRGRVVAATAAATATTAATALRALGGPVAGGDIGGIGGDDDLVEDEAVLAHPGVEGVDPRGGDVDGGGEHGTGVGGIPAAVGPGPAGQEALQGLAGGDLGAIEADMNGVVAGVAADAAHPDVVGAGGDEVDVEVEARAVQRREVVLDVGAVVGFGLHGATAGEAGIAGGGPVVPGGRQVVMKVLRLDGEETLRARVLLEGRNGHGRSRVEKNECLNSN